VAENVEELREVERLLIAELKIVNKHIARSRKRLKDLLSEEYPHVVLADGTKHYFRKSELRDLAARLSGDEVEELLLPIVIVSRPDMGEGAMVIEDPVASRVVARLLGLKNCSNPLIIYKPHLAFLRSLYDTVFQVVMYLPLSEDGRGHAY